MDASESLLPPNDQILGTAANYLLQGGESEEAVLLLASNLRATLTGYEDMNLAGVNIELAGPRELYDALKNHMSARVETIQSAIRSALPKEFFLDTLFPRSASIALDPMWRENMLELIRGEGVSNQGVGSDNKYIWEGLRFRSYPERMIAIALNQANVLFLPNCRARLNAGSTRLNREPDFLVCDKAHWAILQVDGEAFHPPQTAAKDKEWDRLFEFHGVRVHRFQANHCIEDPNAVVAAFLRLLHQDF
jgi:hypothetical protein